MDACIQYHALCAMQVLPIKKTDKLAAMLPVEEYKEEAYLLMATENGLIKKTPLSQFQDVRANGLIAMKLKASSLVVIAL